MSASSPTKPRSALYRSWFLLGLLEQPPPVLDEPHQMHFEP
jgi:hypothetical protein